MVPAHVSSQKENESLAAIQPILSLKWAIKFVCSHGPFSNSATRWLPGASFRENVRRNNNPPLYLDPARHQEWLRCFWLRLCAEEICEFKPRSQLLPASEKISSPCVTSSLFNCLRSKKFQDAPLQLCDCDERKFLAKAFFVLCVRTFFPSPNLSCKHFRCAHLSAGDAGSGCGVHQMTAAPSESILSHSSLGGKRTLQPSRQEYRAVLTAF